MKRYQPLTALLSLILLACLSGVEGQYTQYTPQQGEVIGQPTQAVSVGYPTTAQTPQVGQTTDQYSQYYTMGPAPNTHITPPQPFVTEGNTPTTVYFSYQRQPVAYSQYESNPTGINSLWIKGSTSWAQYAEVPQGAIVPLLAVSPNGGNGYIREMDPNGQMYNYNYFFYPYSQLTFYADTPGRHSIHFGLAGQPSNHVVIDVIGTYKPPSYYNPPSYYSGYYPYYGDYWGWGDGFFGGGFGNEEVGEGGEMHESGETHEGGGGTMIGGGGGTSGTGGGEIGEGRGGEVGEGHGGEGGKR